jgi:tetratricopeptide (TPR) repeat protein
MTVKSAPEMFDAAEKALDEGIDTILHALSEARNKAASTLFTDDELEFFYSIGYASYSQGKFEEALPMFQRVARYRPAEPRYLKAMAACHEVCGNMEAARNAYALLMCVDPNDAEAGSRFARCVAVLERQDLPVQASTPHRDAEAHFSG